MAPVNAEGHDGVRVMTVHAAKGLEFEVVAVPDLSRGLAAGHRHADVVIDTGRGEGSARFGMRLAFPSEDSTGLWELFGLNAEESSKESDEGGRLVYVAATRAKRRLILSGIFKDGDLEAAEKPKPNDSPLRRFLPELTRAGWDGGEAALDGPRLSIRVNEPGEARAKELSERASDAGGLEAEPDDGEALMVDTGPRPVPVGHLSYSSLADFERCGYRFYAERVLGLAPGALAPPSANGESGELGDGDGRATDELADGPDGERESADHRARSLAFGNAVHAALEWSARNGWRVPPDEHLEALFAAAGPHAVERASGLIAGWLTSGLRAELDGTEARPEVPFALPLGGTIVRGKIDLLAQTASGSVVVDFKTDAVGADGVAAPGEHYRAQREAMLWSRPRRREGLRARARRSTFLPRPPETRWWRRWARSSSPPRRSGWPGSCSACVRATTRRRTNRRVRSASAALRPGTYARTRRGSRGRERAGALRLRIAGQPGERGGDPWPRSRVGRARAPARRRAAGHFPTTWR